MELILHEEIDLLVEPHHEVLLEFWIVAEVPFAFKLLEQYFRPSLRVLEDLRPEVWIIQVYILVRHLGDELRLGEAVGAADLVEVGDPRVPLQDLLDVLLDECLGLRLRLIQEPDNPLLQQDVDLFLPDDVATKLNDLRVAAFGGKLRSGEGSSEEDGLVKTELLGGALEHL